MRYDTEGKGGAFTIELDECIAEAADKLMSIGAGQLVVTSSDRVVGTITEKGILDCAAENHVAWKCEVFRHMDIRNHVTEKSSRGAGP